MGAERAFLDPKLVYGKSRLGTIWTEDDEYHAQRYTRYPITYVLFVPYNFLVWLFLARNLLCPFPPVVIIIIIIIITMFFSSLVLPLPRSRLPLHHIITIVLSLRFCGWVDPFSVLGNGPIFVSGIRKGQESCVVLWSVGWLDFAIDTPTYSRCLSVV